VSGRDPATIDEIVAEVYTVPTEAPEADGTFSWSATTAVTVTVRAGDVTGLGWTYSTATAAAVVRDHLADAVLGTPIADVTGAWEAMHRACRNLGTRGLVMQAMSAVDIALWDAKARAAEMPLTRLMGAVRDEVAVYGSGGFTTMTDEQLAEQVDGWREAGCAAMKIKIGESWGTRVERDLARVDQLADLAGGAQLMVDANGGYTVGQARRVGAALDDRGVVWFEEPVSSDDVDGLRVVRDAVRCDVAAGEYVAEMYDAAQLCPVVDCLQLDVTRCGGYTGFLRSAAVAAAHNLQVSGHCAPSLHIPVCAAIPNFRPIEYFADHARLEPMLFDGVPEVRGGVLVAGVEAGHGYSVAERAEQFRR
jgi:L-alanine-DL-glutamate epimerase-like enolase superfamily enzyme